VQFGGRTRHRPIIESGCNRNTFLYLDLPACGAAAFVVEDDDDVDGDSDQVIKLALLEERWHSHMISVASVLLILIHHAAGAPTTKELYSRRIGGVVRFAGVAEQPHRFALSVFFLG